MRRILLAMLLLGTQLSYAQIISNIGSYKASGSNFFKVTYFDQDIRSFNEVVMSAREAGIDLKSRCREISVGVDEFGDVRLKKACTIIFYRADDGNWNQEGDHHPSHIFTASPTITREFFQDSLIGNSMIEILDKDFVKSLRKSSQSTHLKRLYLNETTCRRVSGGASNSSGNGTTCRTRPLFGDTKTQRFYTNSDKKVLCGSSKNKYMKGCYLVVSTNGRISIKSN